MKEEPPLSYSPMESHQAKTIWKASCGPHSIAAACGISLNKTRAHLDGFRGLLNPTEIGAALQSLKQKFNTLGRLKTQKLCEGINRVQWEGPWLDEDRPPHHAYQHTHYVAFRQGWVLCTTIASDRWVPEEEWRKTLSDNKKPLHITHHWEIQPA